MKHSFRSAVSHLAHQPKLLALAAVIACGANLAVEFSALRGQAAPASPIALSNPIIIDDGNPGFTAPTLMVRPGGFTSDNRLLQPNRWFFSNVTAGTYDIYVSWVAAPTNATAVKYTVHTVAGATRTPLETYTVDQTQTPADATHTGNSHWKKLRRVVLTTGQRLEVTGAIEQNAYIDAVALQLIPLADLTVTKSALATAAPGATTAHTFVVRNTGTVSAANVVLTDPVPAGLEFAEAVGTTCFPSRENVVCDGFALGINQSKTITIRYRVPARAVCDSTVTGNPAFVSTSTVESSTENNMSAETSSKIVCGTGDLSVTMTGPDSGTVFGGQTLLYTVTVVNQGPTAVTARIAVRYGPWQKFLPEKSSTTCSYVWPDLVCPNIILAGKGMTTRTIAFEALYEQGEFINHSVNVSGNLKDPNPGNNDIEAVPMEILEQETHTECLGNECRVIPGVGANQCDPGFGCFDDTFHMECQNAQCVRAPGVGPHECDPFIGCNEFHTECRNGGCEQVEGAGPNECDSNISCF